MKQCLLGMLPQISKEKNSGEGEGAWDFPLPAKVPPPPPSQSFENFVVNHYHNIVISKLNAVFFSFNMYHQIPPLLPSHKSQLALVIILNELPKKIPRGKRTDTSLLPLQLKTRYETLYMYVSVCQASSFGINSM